MALQPCTECGAQISDKAATCPQCGAAPEKPKKTRWWLLTLVAVIAMIFAVGFIGGSSPEAQARIHDRSAIDLCWTEQKRPSQEPDGARFIAGVCEKMEADFLVKYGQKP